MKSEFFTVKRDSIAKESFGEITAEDMQRIEEACRENEAHIILYRNRIQIKHGEEPDYYGVVAQGKLKNPIHFAAWILDKIEKACMYDGYYKWNLPHERVSEKANRA